MLLKQPGQGNVVTQFLPNKFKFNATPTQKRQKDDLSEMPGFLSGGLTVLICQVKRSMLRASMRKMFHLCMFADFIWRNRPETV